MKAIARATVLYFALAAAVAVALAASVVPAQAEDFPDFWTGPNNGAWMTVLSHGDLVIPYVVAHPDTAQVECYLRVYEVTGPNWMLVREVPIGTVTAVPSDFCNTGSGDLPFSFTWTDVDLEPGSYRCKVAATDGTRWAVDDMVCGLTVTTTPDTTPPVTTTDYDGLWHSASFTVYLSVADDRNGWGAMGGQARIEYSRDGGSTWVATRWNTVQAVPYPWRKHGGSGIHPLLFRSTDYAGNVEATRSVEVLIDRGPPQTSDDAPLLGQASDVTVHLTAVDGPSGAAACSGVATTWHRLDDGGWTRGAEVLVKAARNAGPHQIAYYSVDAAGNIERTKVCTVTIAAPVAGVGINGVRRKR